jgi:hypothetical protein
MDLLPSDPKAALGFLTVVEHPQHGLFGGYLLLNMAGRPLEFHCTAPIKPNRAQQILYGPTLEAFLYGEQIGGALLAHGKHEPLVVCTDRESLLAVRSLAETPVALVLPREQRTEAAGAANDAMAIDARYRVDGPHALRAPMSMFQVGTNHLAVPQRAEGDRTLITDRLADLDEMFDLTEPFARIREAIAEAQQAAAS